MKRAAIFLLGPAARPFTIMAGAILVLALMDRGTGYFFSLGTVFSVMQLFATLGLAALGLGLSMLVREFDLSVAGIVGLAGCIAVMTGVSNPWLGVFLGVGAGVASGALQGLIMTRLGLSSVGVTLGGLLTLQGLTYVLTENKTIGYPNLAVALELNAPIANLLSVRSAAALAVFVLAALVMACTHIGYDVIATGSDRRASRVAGLNTGHCRCVRSFWSIGCARRRAAQLQPRGGISRSPRRRVSTGGGSRDRGRRFGGRGSPMGIAAFRTERDRGRAARSRSRHRHHPHGHRYCRRTRSGETRHRLAP